MRDAAETVVHGVLLLYQSARRSEHQQSVQYDNGTAHGPSEADGSVKHALGQSVRRQNEILMGRQIETKRAKRQYRNTTTQQRADTVTQPYFTVPRKDTNSCFRLDQLIFS